MSIIALYVYSPTTFQTTATIEEISGQRFAAGAVNLLAGIYRLDEGAGLVPAKDAKASDFEIVAPVVAFGGTKGGWPDPPARAITEKTSVAKIRSFLEGAGNHGELD